MPADHLGRKCGGCGRRNKKLIGWVSWCEVEAPSCPACRDLYGRRNPPQEPPCDECKVDLAEENFDAARIYHIVKRQVRTAGGSGEIIDLDHAAVKFVMDIYSIKNQQKTFEKITQTFHHFLAERANRG